MHLGQLVFRNAFRSPLRTGMTVLTVGVMLTAFIFPRALIESQRQSVRDAPNNRVVVQSRRGWETPLPSRYVDEIGSMDGVRHASGMRQAGFRVPGREGSFFVSYGVNARAFMAMHDELAAPERDKEAFLADPHGAIVSVELARQFGWTLGQRIVLESSIYSAQWQVTICAIFTEAGGEWARRSMFVHYDRLNRALVGEDKDKDNLIIVQVVDPSQGGLIARAIDQAHDAAAVRTLSMEDRIYTAANMGRAGAVLETLNSVSYLVLLIILVTMISSLMLNVRERSREFAVLRALGFEARHIFLLVMGEAALLGCAGSALGVAFCYPLLGGLVSAYLKENLDFAFVEIPTRATLTAFVNGLALSLLAAWAPANRIRRLEVCEALKRVV
jgi:putative ABC transport system permease protein